MTQSERRRERIERGLCAFCGKNPHREGRTLCQPCADYMRYAHKKHYYSHKERGLCPKCGKPPEPGYVQCRHCLELNRKNKKNAMKRSEGDG